MRQLSILFGILLTLPVFGAPRNSFPAWAELCGIRVGVDSMETLERKLGPGEPCIGGHARSGRAWRLPEAGCDVYADAFHYNDRGERVLDTLSMTRLQADSTAPMAALGWRLTLFNRQVRLGMSKEQVSEALGSKWPAPKVDGAAWVWKAVGSVPFNRRNRYATQQWQATLRFEKGRLAEIMLQSSLNK